MTKEERKQYGKELREWRKAHGICIRCGKSDAEPGKTMCPDCLIIVRDQARELYRKKVNAMSERELEARNAEKRRRYAEKRELGLCVRCSRPAHRNGTHCFEHSVSHASYQRERQRKND